MNHGLFSRHHTVHDMLLTEGDVHHIFPRAYLKKHGMGRSLYNRLSNLVYIDQPANITIGAKPPSDYFNAVLEAVDRKGTIGDLRTKADLKANMAENCIPEGIFDYGLKQYERFLEERKVLMAAKIRGWYEGL